MAQQNVVQISLLGDWQGQPWAHVVNLSARSTDPAITPTAVDLLKDAFWLAFRTNMLPLLANTLTVKLVNAVELGVTLLYPSVPPQMRFTVVYQSPPTTPSAVGGVVSDPLAQFNALYARFRTANGARRYKGSYHLPGLAEGDVTGQFVKAGSLVVFQAASDLIYPVTYVVTSGGLTWNFKVGVFSRRYALLNGPGSNPWDYIADLTSAIISPRVGSLTRRKTKQLP